MADGSAREVRSEIAGRIGGVFLRGVLVPGFLGMAIFPAVMALTGVIRAAERHGMGWLAGVELFTPLIVLCPVAIFSLLGAMAPMSEGAQARMVLGLSSINAVEYVALGLVAQLVLLGIPARTRVGLLGRRWWFVLAVTVALQVGLGSLVLVALSRSAP